MQSALPLAMRFNTKQNINLLRWITVKLDNGKFIFFICAMAIAQNSHSRTATDVFELTSKSIVVVYSESTNQISNKFGSGVAIGVGEVVTNCHVVDKAEKISVKYSSNVVLAKIKSADWDRDICILSVPELAIQTVKLGSSLLAKVGQMVYAVGAPKGLELSLSEGIISGFREVPGGRYIQTTAAISKGSSGGGLFDERGLLIGLMTFTIEEGQQLNFAIPIEWVKELPKNQTTASLSPSAYSERSTWHKKAIEFEKEHNYKAALNHALAWTKARPKEADAWAYLGETHINLGHDDNKAIEAFQHSLRLNPNNADVWENLGSTYPDKNITKAIAAYERSLSINPNNPNAWQVIGILYRKNGQPEKTVEAIQMAIRLKPDDARAWSNLGDIYYWYLHKEDSKVNAADAYKRAVSLDPENTIYWNGLGNAYSYLRKNEQAIESYEHTLKINPNNPGALSGLGSIYSRKMDHKRAIDYYNRALQSNPDDSILLSMLGREYNNSGDKDNALDVYRRLKKIDKRAAEMYFMDVLTP